MEELLVLVFPNNYIGIGIVVTLATGFATRVGRPPVLITMDVSEQVRDTLSSCAAG